MQVAVFLSKHGLAAHAERLDRRGLCDDLSCLLALELPHTPTLSLTLALSLSLTLMLALALALTLALTSWLLAFSRRDARALLGMLVRVRVGVRVRLDPNPNPYPYQVRC